MRAVPSHNGPLLTHPDAVTSPSLKLDRLDLRILSQLQKNGRITNVDLADAV
ncbi:MAG: winged helix-turn-helix transcriptional regulator, partial [Rhizobacter sp.]